MLNFNRLLSLIAFFNTTENIYIDYRVLIITSFIHIQLAYLLNHEKKSSNPFILVLVLVIIFFYLLRIFTLLADEFHFSLVFNRIGTENIGSSDFFYFLLFLFVSIWAIFFGINVAQLNKRNNRKRFVYDITNRKIKKLLVLTLISVVYFIFSGLNIAQVSSVGLFLGLFTSFLNYEVFVILLTIIIFNYKNRISPAIYKLAIIMLILFFLIKSLSGSSGPMLRIGFPFLFTYLVIKKEIFIKIKFLVIILFLLIFTTFFGAYLKFSKDVINKDTISNFKKIESDDYRFLFSQLVARSGFLDFSIEIINNKDYYKFINLKRYSKSIIDAYTPGFDVFDEPLTANILRAVYLKSFPSKPSKLDVINDYHSDQINIFAEYYILFGPVFSIFFLFLSGFIFQSLFNIFLYHTKDNFSGLLFSSSLINYFWIWLRSFGLDWMIADLPAYILPLLLIIIFKKVSFKLNKHEVYN